MNFRLDAFAVNWANPPQDMWPVPLPLRVNLPDDGEPDSWHIHWGSEALVPGPTKRHTRRRALVNAYFRRWAHELRGEHADKWDSARLDFQDQMERLVIGAAAGVGIVGLLVGLSETVGRIVV